MKIFPMKIKEQEQSTIKELLRAVIVDRQSSLTNVYTHTYRTLDQLYKWVDKNTPNKTLKEVEK